MPNWGLNLPSEVILWIIPTLVVIAMAANTWRVTHQLDPYKPIPSATPPLNIQVIALQWKWLFIYPKQNIATVNYVQFPAQTPIHFELTADAPMNSFWIPQLGGQMYAMAGMATQLNLIANKPGEFVGSDAEISGKGFASMRFTAKATSLDEFNNWVWSVKQSSNKLDWSEYTRLARPSENIPVTYYSYFENGLYNKVIEKFTTPPGLKPSGAIGHD